MCTFDGMMNSRGFLHTAQQHDFDDPSEVMGIYEDGKEMRYRILFKKQGFRKPTLFKNKDGLGLEVPDKDFGIDDVAELVGTL